LAVLDEIEMVQDEGVVHYIEFVCGKRRKGGGVI
jgi:hypothetical protein